MTYQTIELEKQGSTATISLNRPLKHNAFNGQLIAELTQAFLQLAENSQISTLLLQGKGKSFSAGADINWMRQVTGYGYEKNYEESLQLAKCLHAIYNTPQITIALAHGNAIGGALGLLAACDFVLADENALFALKEVKLGLIPACIAPYIVKRVGEFPAKDLMFTGKTIDAQKAAQIGLINQITKTGQLQENGQQLIASIQGMGKQTLRACKQMINKVANTNLNPSTLEYTAHAIAKQRVSPEGQEGMAAFLEKRKPTWE